MVEGIVIIREPVFITPTSEPFDLEENVELPNMEEKNSGSKFFFYFAIYVLFRILIAIGELLIFFRTTFWKKDCQFVWFLFLASCILHLCSPCSFHCGNFFTGLIWSINWCLALVIVISVIDRGFYFYDSCELAQGEKDGIFIMLNIEFIFSISVLLASIGVFIS